MRRLALAVLHLCFVSTLAIAQAPATAASANPEARATRAFNAARAAGPLQLHAFLANMPKGADLHMHLGGAVYAESFIAQAAADRLSGEVIQKRLSRKRCMAESLAELPRGFFLRLEPFRDRSPRRR